jgi:hypothetical protein
MFQRSEEKKLLSPTFHLWGWRQRLEGKRGRPAGNGGGTGHHWNKQVQKLEETNIYSPIKFFLIKIKY